MTCAKVSARGSNLRATGRTSLLRAGFAEGERIAATTGEGAEGKEIEGVGAVGDVSGATEDVGGDAGEVEGTGGSSDAIVIAAGCSSGSRPRDSPHINAAPSNPLPSATATSRDRARGAARA